MPHGSTIASALCATAQLQVDFDVLSDGYITVQSVWNGCDSERFPLPLFHRRTRHHADAPAAATQSTIGSLRTVVMSDVGHDMHDDDPQTYVAHVLDAMHVHA
jgi:hypothetical protein